MLKSCREEKTVISRLHIFGTCLMTLFILWVQVSGQTMPKEELVFLTAEWTGDRFPNGRPRVSDAVLERMRNVSIEEAWGVLRQEGFHNQFAGGWRMIHEDRSIIGRAVTAMYAPSRPDVQKRMLERGHASGRIGAMNSWPIDVLEKGDVYVADAFGKIKDGTLIGDNLGNSIYAKSGNGVIFDGSLRDLEGLEKIDGFNAFVRGWDPTAIREMMLLGLNTPIRIGEAIVLPGDVVLAKREGVIFIPAHLAELVVQRAERIMLRDQFGHQRLREGKYTPGQIDTRWTDEIMEDFFQWLKQNRDRLGIPAQTIDKILSERNLLNRLSDEEKAEGWQLLFDGESLDRWRGFKMESIPPGWQADDGLLVFNAEHGEEGYGDLTTREQFADFELSLQWKIEPCGNSGVLFRVSEDSDQEWHSGPELQIVDATEGCWSDYRAPDEKRAPGSDLTRAQLSGANYDLHPPSIDLTRPVGEWNDMRLLVDGPHVEHWFNGQKVVEYDLWTDEWKEMVAASKFVEYPKYGMNRTGHIVLQDHGKTVWFRNIKIRSLN